MNDAQKAIELEVQRATNVILHSWDDWVEVGGQDAQQAQDSDAWEDCMFVQVEAVIAGCIEEVTPMIAYLGCNGELWDALDEARCTLVTFVGNIKVERYNEQQGRIIRGGITKDPWQGVPEMLQEKIKSIEAALAKYETGMAIAISKLAAEELL